MMIPAWPALAVISLLVGGMLGWASRGHTAHDRYLEAQVSRYQAEKRWLDAWTAAAMAEVDKDIRQLKTDLKNRKGGKRGNIRGN
ncbi:MAG: hypothetical protein VB050_03400 [Geobacteraceae bacterium]|nr:hypothetical protein [Geobacteraceae bacterium]